MGYVKESERNTAWYLFNKLFLVRVNPQKIRTVEEIKLYGTATTGNEEYDRELSKSEEQRMLCIAQMEDIFRQGYTVSVVKRDDIPLMYKLVTDHLIAIRDTMTGSENFTRDPEFLDELIRLDKFAEAIFGHARYQIKQDIPQSTLAQALMGGDDRFVALGRLGRKRAPAPAPKAQGGGGRDYGTGADVLAQPPATQPPATQDLPEQKEDPNLPKRVSLERLFEQQKRMGMQWK